MVYGAARRKDGSASVLFDPGTEWTVPLYSCASASKALIKTVQFRYNGTEGLRSLDILDIKPKSYANVDESMHSRLSISYTSLNCADLIHRTTVGS